MPSARHLPVLALLAACAQEPQQDQPDLASSPDLLAPSEQAVTLSFKATFGAKPIDCNGSFTGVGTGQEHIHPGDVRLYVSNVRLVTSAGAEVKVKLKADSTWQSSEVAMLDFTDNQGECTGSAETRTKIEGTVLRDGATLSGLRFTLGVPFAQNHKDVTAAAAPLNDSSMFWSWNSGYKFFVLEGRNHNDKTFLFHLGSTGCVKDMNNQVTSCSSPNRVEVDLPGFDPTRAVVVDLAQVLAGTNLDQEVACHSSGAQPDCVPLFARIGLPLNGVMPLPLKAFRVE